MHNGDGVCDSGSKGGSEQIKKVATHWGGRFV